MSKSFIPSEPVDNTALINSIVSQLDSKITDARDQITSDTNEIDSALNGLVTVNGEIDTNVQAINTHVTTESDRVLSNITIPNFAPEADLSGQSKNVLSFNSTVLDSSKFNALVSSNTLETQVFQNCTGYLIRLQLRRGWEFELWIDGKLFLSRYDVSNTSNNDVLLPHTYIVPEPVRIETSIELKVRKHADMSAYWTAIDVLETK